MTYCLFLLLESKPKRRQRVEVPDADFRPQLAEMTAPVVYMETNKMMEEDKDKIKDRVSF